MLDKGVYSVFIEKDETTYKVENKAGVGFINEAMKGNLKIKKTSSDGKVEGFTFKVTGVNGYDSTFTTDKNGEISVDGLRIGEYTVSEVSDNVSAGYILPADKKVTVKVGETAEIEMHNELRDTPKTGDDRKTGLWVALAGASALGIVATVVASKRRLGIDTGEYFEADDFRDVTNFNTQDTMNALGFATNQTLADVGTEWFEEADNAFRQTPDFTDCTSATMEALIENAERSDMVVTNIGNVPIEDYREIIANQNGFDSYVEMYNEGIRIGNGYDKEPEPIKPQWENKKSKVKSFDLHPDIPMAERNTFDLRSNPVEPAGKKERFRRNMEAIKVLKECEFENRFATPEEQLILSKYVGWGGLSEAFDENKADMFFKRTIKPHKPVEKVETASEALAVSMGEKAGIDMEYMSKLTGKNEETLYQDLKGVIFLNPLHGYGNVTEAKYLMADEYLSGNVREKLITAKKSAEVYPEDYKINVEALEKVQPKDLTASEISVRLGATWLPQEVIQQFMFEFLDTPRYAQWNIKVHFSPYTGEWNIEGKSYDRSNVKAYSTYGTGRINAYKIIEETLNLKDVRIFDYIEDDEGRKKAVLNKKETAIAQAKQELIKQGFQDWIWADPDRREKLTKMYNEKFNSIRPREYDGSHITFSGMNPEITLREHQRNAVAHILYGGNTLLAHAVGAGKTFEMVAASQESKRLGLCNKSLFVVPNHLTEQWAAEYLQLYPSANILVATKKDFETKNRKKFCGRIATGDYDAVIIGHSQFEKIPMSIERQRAILEQQLNELTEGIAELKRNRGENFSVKQLEKSRKSVKQKLQKLNDQSRKDDVVTFEELGVDRLFIDESHYYKNLYLYTKMRNVGGIAQTEAQKSSDLFMKCRYLDEITGGRGTVFATGTPISNSMVELYTIQRYLQYNTLVKNGLQHFDAWASTFGETVTAIELTPEGTGYRAKTRFAKFYNLPELMAMFKEVADIKIADMLNLPVPEAEYHNVSVEPSEMQKEMVASLAERAEKVRGGGVDSSVDNMLKITNDGKKQR